ncbi:MAG: hypothetical protein FJZ11_05520 [Candidatus Omnitrophica bacterium]|nr:hypothetical protein [Candidatus Omnitrophota bacterium]
MKYRLKREKGLVLVTVIIFVLILSILAVSILFIMTGESRLTERQIKRIQAGYAVQAGIQHYLNLLKTNSTPGLQNIIIDNISVGIEKIDNPSSDPACPDSASPNDPSCIKAQAGNYSSGL